MSVIVHIELSRLKPNPYRNLDTYPWIESKLEALQRSYADIGIFAGVTARPHGDGYQLWFGHHRVEAARRAGRDTMPIIVADASNEQMIRAMAHENAEDFATDFLIQLNTWEGGLQYFAGLSQQVAKKPEPLEIARLLGMTRPDPGGRHGDRLDTVAEACNAAHALISSGHLDRNDLRGLTVVAARSLTQAVLAQMERIDKMARLSKSPASSVDTAKTFVAKAGKVTARQVREGKVSTTAIRTEVAANAFGNAAKAAREDQRQLPLLPVFADALCRSVSKMLIDDYAAEKLTQIHKALPSITLAEDHAAIRRVQFELDELAKRAGHWSKRVTPLSDKLTAITGGSHVSSTE